MIIQILAGILIAFLMVQFERALDNVNQVGFFKGLAFLLGSVVCLIVGAFVLYQGNILKNKEFLPFILSAASVYLLEEFFKSKRSSRAKIPQRDINHLFMEGRISDRKARELSDEN